MALIGYVRVSRGDAPQIFDLQRRALIAAGVEPENIYTDIAKESLDKRPGLDTAISTLRSGDKFVVWKFDRIGRSVRHLINLVHELDIRGVDLKILIGCPAEDTSTQAGKLMIAVFACIAEFERSLTIERTKASLAITGPRGHREGRPTKMTKAKLHMVVDAMTKRETDVADLAKQLNITRQSLYRYVTPDGALRPDGERLMARPDRGKIGHRKAR
jgi:DNA invertase Pin-like site-specific DNA recombinase